MLRVISSIIVAMAAIAGALDPLVLGLNGALQRRVGLAKPLAVSSVNRASESSSGVGGKGQGAWVATQRLWRARCGPRPQLAQFYGTGDEGDALAAALRAATPGGIDEALWVRTAAPTRICTTLVSPDGDATEIVEPSGEVAPRECDAMLTGLTYGGGGAAAGVLVMGSMPPGVPADFYARIVEASNVDGAVLIDSVAGLAPLLAACAKRGARAVLKLNGRELLALAGAPPVAGSDAAVACEPELVADAARTVAAAHPAGALDFVLWTDGPFPAGCVEIASGRRWTLKLPPLPGPVLSPIGAGDAVAGGTFSYWLKGADEGTAAGAADAPPLIVRAFGFGLACGAASCLTAENSVFELETVDALHAELICEEVSASV